MMKLKSPHPKHLRDMLNSLKFKVLRKGLPFDLNIDYIAELYGKGCALTGVDFGDGPLTPVVKRIDPKYGYLKGNCLLVSSFANELSKYDPVVVKDLVFRYFSRRKG